MEIGSLWVAVVSGVTKILPRKMIRDRKLRTGSSYLMEGWPVRTSRGGRMIRMLRWAGIGRLLRENCTLALAV